MTRCARNQAAALLAAACLAWCSGAAALGVTYTTPQEAAYNALLSSPAVPLGLGKIGTLAPLAFEEQKRLAAVPMRNRQAVRAQYVLQVMHGVDLEGAYIDNAGNVVGERLGLLHSPRLVIAARLDRGDDVRALAAMLAVLRLMQARRMQTVGDVVFVAINDTAGTRGTAALLGELKGVDGLIAIDGKRALRAVKPGAKAKAPVTPLFDAVSRAAQLMAAEAPGLPVAGTAAAALGMPAVVVSGGGNAAARPLPGQQYRPDDEWKSPQTVLLSTLALTGLAGVCDPLLAPRPTAPVKPRPLR